MSTGLLSRSSSQRLALLFLAVVAPPAATLVWLGLQLLEQDRSLWAQREMERRQAAAQAAIYALEQSLQDAERRLWEGPLPEGVVRLTASARGVEAQPAGSVLWLPIAPATEAAGGRPFAEAEKLEFQQAAQRARPLYEDLARSPAPAIRAGALLRLARVLWREHQWDEALSAYRRLALVRQVSVDGVPADLLARRASCSLLEEAGRKQDLAREAAALQADFFSGSWVLDRPAWELAAGQIAQWTGRSLAVPAQRRALSAVADWLWDEWQRHPGQPLPSSLRRVLVVEETPVTVLLRSERGQLSTLSILPPVLQTWMQKAMQGIPDAGGQLSLLTDSGQVLIGPQPPPSAAVVKRGASETGLPWTLAISPGDTSRPAQDLANRRRLLSLGLAAIVLLLAGGSYLLWRAVQTELAVARLQTGFVAAVSHEFRTPLASLRHVTELLQEDDDLPRNRRQSFYDALGRNTERLHRLVESLLDFARMEGGRKPYDLRPVDAGELTTQVVADFSKEVAPSGFTVDLEIETPSAPPVRADRASLTNALWNLLDNAVKYSPGGHTVRVGVRRHPAGVAISVQDEGLGIPRQERKGIFRRFVRGAHSERLGIQGTGLGLAMVSHIVAAHGGRIELESKEGAGSTFRIVLPAAG